MVIPRLQCRRGLPFRRPQRGTATAPIRVPGAWRSGAPQQCGMWIEARFARPFVVDRLCMFCEHHRPSRPLELDVRDPSSIEKMAADGNIVMAYSTTTGTHTGGEWLGQEATGNRLSFDVVDIFRLQDGKIAEHWDVADTFTFFSTLGIARRMLGES